MSLEKELETRSGGVCELCGSSEGLSAFEVAPSDGSAQQSIYLCSTCKEQIENPDKMNEAHFNCLNDSMWSETPAVAVMSYRLLKALGREDLVDMIEEEKLNYMGSVVLGLNDALVELTGALAGLSFVLQNTKLIALAGLITGIAASFSMAASEYLSTKSEGNKNSLKSALYTGLAYIITVLFLIFPFLTLADYRGALGWTLVNAIAVIAIFTYFSAVTKDLRFKKLFGEMFIISLGVAAFSFGISIVLKKVFNLEI